MREEMLEKIIKKLPDKDLTIISITRSNSQSFKWTDKNEEFRFEGKLYDLVRVRKAVDTTFFYCINDTQEEKLIANLDEHLQRETDNQLPQNKKINNNLEKLIKDYIRHNYLFLILNNELEFRYYSFCDTLTCFYPDIATPPPKV